VETIQKAVRTPLSMGSQQKQNTVLDRPNPSPHRCEEVYEMEEIIGEGTYSDVVRGVHNGNKSRVAIKIIDKKKVQNAKQRWRIQNEIDLHKKCVHPNIVKFIEPYESDLDICLVMELCEGGELFNRIVNKGCFSEKEANRISKQILSAVQSMHSMGIVHRDIKPENLLCTNKNDDTDVKLADFGLAKQLEPNGRSLLKASLSGTTAYCAPERLNQDQESKAVDMWSVGCILYFLLFGVPPFYSEKEDDEENEDEIYKCVMKGEIRFPNNTSISDQAKDMILRLLEKDPSKRLAADQALLHPWLRNFSPSEAKFSNLHKGTNVNGRAMLKSSINRVIDVHCREDTN